MTILKKQQTEVFSLLLLILCPFQRLSVAQQVQPVLCNQFPCKNGGYCMNIQAEVNSMTIDSFTCQCPSGTLQPLCDAFVPCYPNSPCLNSGTCLNTVVNGAQCSCLLQQYVQPFCDYDCKLRFFDDPCYNGGTCTHHGVCFCPVGFYGQLCQAVDSEDPVVSCIGDVTQSIQLGIGSVSVLWTEPTATDNSGSVSIQKSHAPGSSFERGTTDVTYIFADPARNTAICMFKVIVNEIVDFEDPVVDCSGEDSTWYAPEGASGVTLNNLPRCRSTDNSGQTVFLSQTLPSGSFFPVGDTVVSVWYQDNSGNTGVGQFTVTVLRGIVITCPTDGVGQLNAVTGDITGFWSDPECTGGVSPLSILCNPPSGSVIGVGNTQVVCTCTDMRGTTKECVFTVSIDDEPPTISNCPTSDVTVNIYAGQTEGVAVWMVPTATDASGGVTVNVPSHAPGDSFPVGTTQVEYKFTDRFNNMAVCAFTVLVYTVAINCPPPISIPYGMPLLYVTPTCTRSRGSTTSSSTSPAICNPRNGLSAQQDSFVMCRCSIAQEIICNFQILVTTSVVCPPPKTVSPGLPLSYDVPQCMNGQGARPALCVPSKDSIATTDTSVTCTCPEDGSIFCNFQVFVDCIIDEGTFCANPVSCDCMNESCDPDSRICSSSCTIWNTCPATIESMSLSQVNPFSSVDITCTLRGSRTILEKLQLRLSARSDKSVGGTGVQNIINSGDKVTSTHRADNVTRESILHCVLLQGIYLIGSVSVTDFVHELPVLNAALTSENVSNTTIAISWRAWNPTLDDGDPPIVAYIPYYRRVASDEWTNGSRILTNETLQFKAEGLEVDTQYDFSVATVREGENGEGPRSTPLTVKTFCNVPDSTGITVDVQLTSSKSVNVSWQLPANEVMCSTGVTSYKVYYRIEGNNDRPQLAGTVDDVNTRWFIIDDDLLEPESSYIFFVTVTTDRESEFRESEPIQVSAGPGTSSFPIVAVIVGVVGILLILVVIVLVLIKRRRGKEDDNTPALNPSDSTYMNPGFYEPTESGAEAAIVTGPEVEIKRSESRDFDKSEDIDVENKTFPPDDVIIYGNLEQPNPIKATDFGEYFRQNSDKFEHEFSILKGSKQQFDWTVAENPANKKKNRFKNMYTYDHSRVVLKYLPDQEGSDYYNASFIKDINDKVAYIASQAPNKASLEDFVRMIWEQHVTTIVMVANLYEDGKERCLQYWPENEGSTKFIGSIIVRWMKTMQFSDFVIRYLSFKRGNETREVQQLHFLTWPDKDTPEHGTGLIEFVKQSKQIHHKKKYPMLVHCSAGIGRTGTFICLSCMMDVLRDREFIDVFAFVNKMRENRINMVQTSKQYVFLYKCLNEYHLTHQTEMSVHQMTGLNVDSHRGMLLGEFELLYELGHSHRKDTVKNCVGKRRENIARNRVRNMVPSNRNRVFLMSRGQSNEDGYVNASYVKSFQKKDAFITTQSPLPNTIEDFWRMVYDVKSPLIVMLNQLDQEDKCQNFDLCPVLAGSWF